MKKYGPCMHEQPQPTKKLYVVCITLAQEDINTKSSRFTGFPRKRNSPIVKMCIFYLLISDLRVKRMLLPE